MLNLKPTKKQGKSKIIIGWGEWARACLYTFLRSTTLISCTNIFWEFVLLFYLNVHDNFKSKELKSPEETGDRCDVLSAVLYITEWK